MLGCFFLLTIGEFVCDSVCVCKCVLELAFDDTFVKPFQWSSILQAYSRVLHDQYFPKRVAMDVYCNIY